jgi:hypothetical protein
MCFRRTNHTFSGGFAMCRILPFIFCNLFCFNLAAAPNIEVNKTTFDCGIVVEGKQDKIAALFEIKNIGDLPLKIENARPSCGCTVVEFDTLIPPGKSGKIKPEVKLKGFSGKIHKTVTIISNAVNTPTLRLTIIAEIQPIIDVLKRYISLSLPKDQSSNKIYFASLKKDLLVKDVSFKVAGKNENEWQNKLTIPIKFEWNKTDSIRTDGLQVFLLTLKGSDLTEPVDGEFIIKTNHPDKSEFNINGRIDNTKQ